MPVRIRALSVALAAALPLLVLSLPSASLAAAASRAGHTAACGETLSSGEVPGSFGGTVCVTGAVWLDHPDVFGAVVIEGGGALSIGYPPNESTPSDCATPWNWDGTATVSGQLTVEHGGSLALQSSTTCSGGGPSELDTRGGIVNDGTVTSATVGGSLALQSSTTCSGGGPSELDTRGGIVNDGTVTSATVGGSGDTKWAILGSRTIVGGFLNKGLLAVDNPLTLTGPGTFQNDGRITAGTYAQPQGEQSETLTVAPPAKGHGPLAFVNGPGGSIELTIWHSGTQYVSGSFTLDAPNTFVQDGGRTKGAPLFDNGGALSYRGSGATTIGIVGSAAVSGTLPRGSVLALSDPVGGGSETCGAAPFVDTAPAGLTVAKGATLIGYGSAPCSSGSSTTLKLGPGKSLQNGGTLIAASCGDASTLLPGTYGKPNVFCVGGENLVLGKVVNTGKVRVESGVTLSLSSLANYQASSHTLKGGSYFTKGGTFQVGGVTVTTPH